ncbi:MAG: RusA family crossover junction endodeoxyribonuclease [bacterium]|nr:RusA family crossover junction endodeoxyribonuclease [bacterium]
MIKFTVYGKPTAKQRPVVTRKGFTFTPKKTQEAEEDFISQACKHRPEELLDGALRLVVRFYMPKPKSKPKKVYFWITRPDLDNYVKLVKDALNKVFWRDDSQIVDLYASKRYGEPARVEVTIYKMYSEEIIGMGGEKVTVGKIEGPTLPEDLEPGETK